MIWHKCHIYTSIFLVWSMYWYLCRKNEMQPKDAFEDESGLVTLVMPNNSHIWIDPICHILNLNRDSLKDPIDMSKKSFRTELYCLRQHLTWLSEKLLHWTQKFTWPYPTPLNNGYLYCYIKIFLWHKFNCTGNCVVTKVGWIVKGVNIVNEINLSNIIFQRILLTIS